MTALLREAQLAAMMLTRIPVGQIANPVPTLPQSVWAFPIVGAGIGLVTGTTFGAASAVGLPLLAAAFLALVVSALLTGGLHEDGLADTADGFGGGATRERKLEIMRDSRIGTYGVLALILVTGLTATAMAATTAWFAFPMIAAASRTAMLLPMTVLPPARPDGLGHGATLTITARTGAALALTLIGIALTGLWFAALVMLATAIGMSALAKHQIGGQTGDVLGATQKLTEGAGWLTLAATVS
ncbi:MAG: adenosylcobinamide-GDP ribazoletransferase [Paracoccaceae bacterium]